MNDPTHDSERRGSDERRREDRRQVSIPVPFERRSGHERRSGGDRRASRSERASAAHEFARLFAVAFA